MSIFDKIIILSKQIAESLLKNGKPEALKNSELFNKADKEHIFKNLMDESLIKERLDLSKQIDKKKDWKKVKNKIEIPTKRLYWKYAAAAILVGTLVTSYHFFIDKSNLPIGTTPTVVDQNINVGTDKATLTLEDGSNVILEKGKSFKSANMNSNGETLVYSPSENSGLKVEFNYLTIPRGGQFNIVLSDGTEVWLNSESQLRFPVTFKTGKSRKVELIYGEAYFDVSPSTENMGTNFTVLNQNHKIEVLGTEFNVKAYKDERNIYTTLVEGKVNINLKDKSKTLKPNEQSIFNLDTRALEVATVDVYNEISWKEGIFSFEDMSLKEITKVLSRWYDVEIVFLNKASENEEFIGRLDKKQDIEQILTSIKNYGIIKSYEINGKTIELR